MIGIVLWYNPDKKVGLVWCEDQGPLAFIGPEIVLPGTAGLGCGDQITFGCETRDKVRYVVDIQMVQHGRTHADPKAILDAYHGEIEARQLRVVA